MKQGVARWDPQFRDTTLVSTGRRDFKSGKKEAGCLLEILKTPLLTHRFRIHPTLRARVLEEDKGGPNLTSVFCTPTLVEGGKKKDPSEKVFLFLESFKWHMNSNGKVHHFKGQAEVPFEKF